MARTKLPAVKRREYTVEEYNALFHAGQTGGRGRVGRRGGGGGGRGGKRIWGVQAARWDQRLVEVKAWVVRERRYPSSRKTPEGEGSMRQWLRDNLPWTKKGGYTHARGKKLNDAFGEGWEADFKDAKWDARLLEVKAWVVEKGDFPRNGRRASEEERSMYNWLCRNLPGRPRYTPDRWNKLNDAFREGWEADFGSRKRPREA